MTASDSIIHKRQGSRMICCFLLLALPLSSTCFSTISPAAGFVRRSDPSIVGAPRSNKVLAVQTPTVRFSNRWEGDDIRWSTRWLRRFRVFGSTSIKRLPTQTSLLAINAIMYIYQCLTSINWIRKQHPEYWPQDALFILWDVLIGSSALGPLERDLVHIPIVSNRQPHRWLTAGLLHGNILHLLVNNDTLRRLPNWLETGLGAPLFLTTYILSILSGNLAYSISSHGTPFQSTAVLGASGGICGLFGLLYIMLVRMGNGRAAQSVARGMGLQFLYGLMIRNVSNAAHVGGFVGGLVVGALCGPHYVRSYAARRKGSLSVDTASRDYRLAMGFGQEPTRRGFLPLSALWTVAFVALAIHPQTRLAPKMFFRSLVRPGSLSMEM